MRASASAFCAAFPLAGRHDPAPIAKTRIFCIQSARFQRRDDGARYLDLAPRRPFLRGVLAKLADDGFLADPGQIVRELIAKIARGDREAFAALYEATAAQLFGIALRILGRRDLAEEALQESFVALWERAGDYSPDRGAPMAWLVTIVRHRAIDNLRRRGSRAQDREISEEALRGIAAGGFYSADRGAELGALQRCLDELDRQPRRAVLLAYVYGLTHQELAANLGAPIGTVKSWIRRSVERLKQCLDG